jgi:hypothetical protein
MRAAAPKCVSLQLTAAYPDRYAFRQAIRFALRHWVPR